jgi:hypothetical protein
MRPFLGAIVLGVTHYSSISVSRDSRPFISFAANLRDCCFDEQGLKINNASNFTEVLVVTPVSLLSTPVDSASALVMIVHRLAIIIVAVLCTKCTPWRVIPC